MAVMTYRTTFALDEATSGRLKRLAKRWNVSQAEVVRRSVEQSEQASGPSRPDAPALLRELHAQGGGITEKRADQWVAESRADRKRWRASP